VDIPGKNDVRIIKKRRINLLQKSPPQTNEEFREDNRPAPAGVIQQAIKILNEYDNQCQRNINSSQR
jgi:hypothetical protein